MWGALGPGLLGLGLRMALGIDHLQGGIVKSTMQGGIDHYNQRVSLAIQHNVQCKVG